MKIKALIIGLFVVCIQPAFAQEVVDEIAAVVGSKIVLKSDVENQYSQFIAQGNVADGSVKCKLLDQMLLNKLLINQAIIDSLPVSDEQVESELDRKLRYFISQIGSQEKLEELYKKSILEIKADNRELLKDQLMAQAMQSKITKEVTATPSDVRNYFNHIPADSLPNINAEYELLQITSKAPVGKEEQAAVKARLEELRQRVLKGENFSTLAVLYSEDPGSAKKGGELGSMSRGDLVPEFEAVAFNLKPNEMSGIVETQFGFHIIQLIERRGNQISCRHILLKPKVQAEELMKAKGKLDSVLVLIDKGDITFDAAAQKYSDDPESKINGGLTVNPQTGTSKFEADQMEPTLLFKIDKMKTGEVSQPLLFQTPDGKQGYRIVKLKSKTEAHKANLKDDYQRIQTAALNEKQAKAMQNWVSKKRTTTFIHINESYKNCPELKDWITKTN